jgi:lactate dehydrogenase-like 2-hydroxyacid dehydrogenase
LTRNESDQPMQEEAIRQALAEADAFCPTVTDRVHAALLSGPEVRVRIIGSYGVGFEHIDLDAARARGITVTNTPEVLTDCTADIAMALLLAAARRIGEGERQVRTGAWTGWRPTHMMGTRVTGKVLGLVGFGRIGQAVARRARFGFGMAVLYCDPHPVPEGVAEEVGATKCDSLGELLARADFVSLHCPSTPETRHLMNAEQIGRMQSHAFLINTSRGDVVDHMALAAALRAGEIAGAGLDVYEGEPNVPDALIALENVVLLPHLGSASLDTRTAMGMRVAKNLEAFFAGETPPDKLV